jgi:hypothetical protein
MERFVSSSQVNASLVLSWVEVVALNASSTTISTFDIRAGASRNAVDADNGRCCSIGVTWGEFIGEKALVQEPTDRIATTAAVNTGVIFVIVPFMLMIVVYFPLELSEGFVYECRRLRSYSPVLSACHHTIFITTSLFYRAFWMPWKF